MTIAPPHANAGSTAVVAKPSPLRASPLEKKRHISAVLCAFILFASLNVFLSTAQPIHFDKYRYVFRGWPWWLLNDLRTDRHPRNVAFLGSSLITSASLCADCKWLNQKLDMTTYHNAAYFDKSMSTNFGGKFSTIDLGIPGQMPSDAYMALRAAIDLGQHPNLVIYCVAPRDFIDSTLPSPIDTETYHYLSRVVDIEPIAPGLFKNPFVKLNRSFEKNVWFYGHSLDIQIAGMDAEQRFMDTVVPTPDSPNPFTYWNRKKVLPDYNAGEIYPTAMIASPNEQSFDASRFIDNTREYIDRYKHPRQEIFDEEMFFCGELARLCERNKIKLVLVNMPITKENISILSEQRYESYLESMHKFSSQENVPFLDLNDFEKYKIEDFHDLVHLNGYGGQKFFDALGVSLAQLLSTGKQ